MKKMASFMFSLLLLTLTIPTFGIIEGSNSNNGYDVAKLEDDNSIVEQEPIPSYDYEVIVIGGDPEGIAAAVSAARNGAKTLLIDYRDGLGGLFTYGYLNQLDIGYDHKGRIVTRGIFAEWFNMIGKKGVFDVNFAKEKFLEMVINEPNITLLLETEVKDIILDNKTITGLILKTPDGEQLVNGKRFIDCTAEAGIAARAGVPYTIGQEDIGLSETIMPVTLVILLKNVEWDKLKEAGDNQVLGGAIVKPDIAWGFPDVPKVYQPTEDKTRVRALNIATQNDGIVTINALQVFGVDGTDRESIKEGIERGKRETVNFLEFLQKELPGFENAEIAGYPPELYIRETRHIKAEYQLSIIDVWENRDQWDSIGFGAYPVDVQATEVTGDETVIVNPIQYAIPFRSLVPLEIEHLLVASKASGYSSLAAGSARTVPIGMTSGEAAGVAATISIKQELNFREMTKNKELIKELQTKLFEQGAFIYPFEFSYPYQDAWFYPAIKSLLPLGLIHAGYENDLHEDELITEWEFLKNLQAAVYRTNKENYNLIVDRFFRIGLFKPWLIKTLDRDKAVGLILYLKDGSYYNSPWKEAEKVGIVDTKLKEQIKENRAITRVEGYYLIAQFLKNYQE